MDKRVLPKRTFLKRVFKSIQTTKFQNYLIFFTIFYIASMLFVQYKQSYFAEKNFIVPKITKKEARLASIVKTGLQINNFSKFSFYNNFFRMDALVWFEFPIGTESIDTIDNFSFRNGRIRQKSKPAIQISDNSVIVSYQVTVDFSTKLNYKYFPSSDHKLTIIIENKSVTPNELYFSSTNKNLNLSGYTATGSWIPINNYVDAGYIEARATYTRAHEKQQIAKLKTKTVFPCVVYTIDFKNEDLRRFIILYLPLILLFLLIFSSLLTMIDDIALRLGIVTGVVPILALHSLVIEKISPISGLITKVDIIFFSIITLSLLILLFQSYTGLTLKELIEKKQIEKFERKKVILEKFNDIFVFLVLICLLIAITYTTFS